MLKDDKEDPNSVLMPRVDGHLRREGLGAPSPNGEAGRFDVMPTASTQAPIKQTPTQAPSVPAAHNQRMTSDNYQEVYKKREKIRAEEAARQAAMATSHGQSLLDKQKEEQDRQHARNIKDQLAFWHGQRGQGQYEESMVLGMIERLNNELAAIPPQYQY